MHAPRLASLLAFGSLLVACSDDASTSEPPVDTGIASDTSTPDTAVPDTGIADSSAADSAPSDATDAPADTSEPAVGALAYAKAYGAAGFDSVTAAAFDGAELYLGGYVTGSSTLDPKTIGGNAFFGRLDATGKARWAISMTSTGYIAPVQMAVTAAGHAIVAIDFSGKATLSGAEYTSAGGIDFLIVDLTPEGTLGWVKQFGGAPNEIVNAIAVEKGTGRIAIGGHYDLVGNIGGALPSSKGNSDAYVAILDASGTKLATVGFGGPVDDDVYALAFDATGKVIAGGKTSGTVDFGGGVTMTSAGNSDAFLLTFDATGTVSRAKRWGGSAYDAVSCLAIDASGKLWMTGDFNSGADFGSGAVTTKGVDAFLVSLDASFATLSVNQYGGDGYDTIHGLGFAADGDLLLGGDFTTAIDFGSGPKTGLGQTDVFAARLTTARTPRWVRTYGSANDEYQYASAISPVGGVALVGTFKVSTTFDTTVLTATTGNDAFYARVTP